MCRGWRSVFPDLFLRGIIRSLRNCETRGSWAQWSNVAQNFGESYSFCLCTGASVTLISQRWQVPRLCREHCFSPPEWWQKKHSSEWLPGQQVQTLWDQRQRRVGWVSCGDNSWQPHLWAQVKHPLRISASNLWTCGRRARNLFYNIITRVEALHWYIIWLQNIHIIPKLPLPNDKYTNYCLKHVT